MERSSAHLSPFGTSTNSIQPPTQTSSRPSEDEIRKMVATAIAEMKEQQEIPVVPSPKPIPDPKPKRQLSEKHILVSERLFDEPYYHHLYFYLGDTR